MEPVATLELIEVSSDGERKPVRVQIGKPHFDERGSWACPVVVTSVSDKVREIHGEDPMQALCLGVQFVRSLLYFLPRARRSVAARRRRNGLSPGGLLWEHRPTRALSQREAAGSVGLRSDARGGCLPWLMLAVRLTIKENEQAKRSQPCGGNRERSGGHNPAAATLYYNPSTSPASSKARSLKR